MFTQLPQGAVAPAVSPAAQIIGNPTEHPPEPVRHMLFGSSYAVRATVNRLHKLRYAEVDDWSQPIPTGRPNEVMAIMTKKVRIR